MSTLDRTQHPATSASTDLILHSICANLFQLGFKLVPFESHKGELLTQSDTDSEWEFWILEWGSYCITGFATEWWKAQEILATVVW